MKEKFPVRNTVAHSMANISYGFAQCVVTFVIYFATESLAITAAAASTMIVAVKVIDAFTDIITGIFIDKVKSKYGKARPWFLWMALPYGLCLTLMFSVSAGLPYAMKLFLLGLFYVLTVSVFGTVIGVARVALVSRATNNQKYRGIIAEIGDTVGGLLVGIIMTVTLPMVAVIGWFNTFLIFGILAFITSILCFFLTKECESEVEEALRMQKKESIRDIFSALFRNKYALILLLIVVITEISFGLMQTGGTYYFQYVAGNINLYSVCMGISLVGGVIGMIVCIPLIGKFGNKVVMIIGYAGILICYAGIFISDGSVPMLTATLLAIISTLLTCCEVGSFSALASMAVDYGEYKTGTRTEGITSCVVNVGIKIGTALAAGVLGWIMSAGGYVEGGVDQSAAAIQSIKAAYLYVPAVFVIIALIVVSTAWTLSKKYPQIKAELDSRKAAQSVQN